MTNEPNPNRQGNRIVRLMLIEDDPLLRLGLATTLDRVPGLQVVFEADSSAAALRILQNWLKNGETMAEPIAPDLVILSLELGLASAGQSTGLSLCQQLRAIYPNLPLLLLGYRPDPLQLAIALQSGVSGYCPRGAEITELVAAIRQIASGRPYWDNAIRTITRTLAANQESEFRIQNSEFSDIRNTQGLSTPVPASPRPRGPASSPAFASLRYRLRLSGLRQIDTAIAQLNAQLQQPTLSLWDVWVLTGHRRELYTARWLVNRLLATDEESEGGRREAGVRRREAGGGSQESGVRSQNLSLTHPPHSPSPRPPVLPSPPLPIPPTPHPPSPALTPASSTAIRSLQAALFDSTSARLQSSLHNLTDNPLEIDILKEEKKRELLLIILRKLEEILDDLRFSQVKPDQLATKRDAILQDLWRTSTMDFLGRYYTLELSDRPVEIVEALLQDGEIVQASILDKIPLVPTFFAHVLFQEPLVIDDAVYTAGSIEAMVRMERLLQNLAVQVANAVMQPLLNRFGNVEVIKHSFYDRRLLSTREIERFRNNLSWRYRMEQYFGEPTAIFESRFDLLSLTEAGIARASIYAPRNEELAALSGIPFAVTLALEARDAISPRLRAAISFVGSGVVYLLTDVIGRGIGLIGRGIVKGIGNALQDVKLSRNERSR